MHSFVASKQTRIHASTFNGSHGRKQLVLRAFKEETPRQQQPQVSRRVLDTDAPCIVKTKKLMASKPGALSLAQGVVHWQPPPEALQAVSSVLQSDPGSVSSYGPAEGLPALREALREKLAKKNGLHGYDVMVTSGANQAFTNVVLALCDEDDAVVLFAPYYFNHLMAVQMSGGGRHVVFGPCDANTLHPDLDWLQQTLGLQHNSNGHSSMGPSRGSGSSRGDIISSTGHSNGGQVTKMVVITNPCNPTGVALSKQEVEQAAAMCAEAGVWLVLDNTYEDFMYEGRAHHCYAAPNIINIFSFSKAYGMMGWRVGYIAYPTAAVRASGHVPSTTTDLAQQLLKVQDTIAICPSTFSQQLALAALNHGEEYVRQHVHDLEGNRALVLHALAPLGTRGDGIAGGEGAIYWWARLPAGCGGDDEAVVEWMVQRHGVAVIPGSACGAPGYIRLAYANLQPEVCQEACARLRAACEELAAHGAAALQLRNQPEAAQAAVPQAGQEAAANVLQQPVHVAADR